MRRVGGLAARGRRAALGALLAGGTLLPAVVAAQEPPRRVRIIRSDSTRDSTVVRVTIETDRIEQAIRDLMASKAMEQAIGQSLRQAASGQSGDPKKLRELSAELARIAQKNASLITTIEMSCAGDRRPDGYIGVQFSELQTVIGDDAPQAPPLPEYPRIDSVYPGSPASRAGVRRGDVVLLIGGLDSRRAVQLDKLLRPATPLPIRVERDGAQRDLTIMVEKRPADFNSECANADQVIGPDFDQPMIYLRSPSAPRPPSSLFVFPPRDAPPAAPGARAAPAPPMPYLYGFSTTNSAIAGATIIPLDDDWRATLGVDNGVLVTRVLPGTPAKDSGLHAGDVIISADGQTVASVRALSRVVGNAKANAVKLQIIRAGKAQALLLRWKESAPDE